MKKILFAACIILVIGSTIRQTNIKSAAVDQVEGFYIYTDSKPVEKFQYIGTVQATQKAYYSPTCFGDLPYSERIGAIRCGGFSARKPNTKHQS